MAIAATLLTSRLGHYGAILGVPATRNVSLVAFQDVFLVMALISLAGCGVAFLIQDRLAAATMRPAGDAHTPAPAGVIAEATD